MSTIVNDFNVTVATVNGSGSQSSNLVLLRSIFHMGVPVSGKNLFPSNISGLPTWFTVRANRNGYVGRKPEDDLRVCMNPETVEQDLASLKPGAWAILNDVLNPPGARDDIHVLRVPFTKLVSGVVKEMKLRKYVMNMVYVGLLAELLGIEEEAVRHALERQFRGKQKAVELNGEAIEAGRAWVRENPQPDFPWRIERMNATEGKILVDGNEAAALGAVAAGLGVLAWYPITPSSSLCEKAMEYLERFRRSEQGERTFAVVQAEDEIASIGMVVGAGWAGARAMTATSGPGLSLMTEIAGLAYYAEIPAVVWDVQRVGPSTGLPTRTAQGDVLMAATLSHGDTKHIVLFPASVIECYEMAGVAFDLAEEFQTPVFVLSDLDLGMNPWMSDPFPALRPALRRGKVLDEEKLRELGSFARYKDVDGDGIPYRTLPGTDHPAAAYFTRGSGHDENAHYTESAEVYRRNVDRLARKYDTARRRVPPPIVDARDGARVGIVAYGSSDAPMTEARDLLRAEGIETSYLRVRALPLNEETTRFVANHERVYVVDQNRDGQMFDLLRLHVGELCPRLHSIRHYDGLPLPAEAVVEGVRAGENVGQKVEV